MKNLGTDKELIDLIKDSLDNHEENYVLGSWERFNRRRKRRRRRIFWLAGTGIAACLLIGWFGFRAIQSGPSSLINNINEQKISNLEIFSTEKNKTGPSLNEKNPVIKAPVKNAPLSGSSKTGKGTADSKQRENNRLNILNRPDNTSPVTAGRNTPEHAFSPSEFLKEDLSAYINPYDTNRSRRLIRPVKSFTGNIDADVRDKDLTGRNSENIVIAENDLPDKRQFDKLRIGFNLSPGMTSANSLSAFSFSGGINAEYAISGKFLISASLQVERQKVTSESTENPAWLPPEEIRADLIDIDLPVNIKWKFFKKKSDSYYLAGGISSVVYLMERYNNTSYTQKMVPTMEMGAEGPSVQYKLENVKTTEIKTEAPFSTFDFAGRVNIIFGVERLISTGLFLHLEPYVKIPVSGLASQNLKFTTSGLACRISF